MIQDKPGIAIPTKPVRYAAIIQNVKEVILTGTADLKFWCETLQPEGFFPINVNG